MISDYQLLGIDKTDDAATIKRAYHRRVKQFHPDTTETEVLVNNHFLFVEVCKAYQRLMVGVSNVALSAAQGTAGTSAAGAPAAGAPEAKASVAAADPGKRLVKHSDPAYAYYKNAIVLFGKIHPSEWKQPERSVFSTEVGSDEEDQREAQRKVMALVSLFPKAYYYFSIVVNEYPESVWASDARDKMVLIEERMVRYKSIIESFSSWKTFVASEKERFQIVMKTTKENYAERYDKMRKYWDGKD
jgi:uncharacterized protein involved in tolerance to divalent cations